MSGDANQHGRDKLLLQRVPTPPPLSAGFVARLGILITLPTSYRRYSSAYGQHHARQVSKDKIDTLCVGTRMVSASVTMVSRETQPEWQIKASNKKRIQSDAIRTFLSQHEEPGNIKAITSITHLEDLVDRVASGELSAADVTIAYCYKFVPMTQNCTTGC